MASVFSLPSKIVSQLRLLKTNPEQFFLNRYHTRNPHLYEQKLFDVERLAPPNVVVDPALALSPTLNVMLPSIGEFMTGGPNTAVNVAFQAASSGVPIRLVSVNARLPESSEQFWTHVRILTGFEAAVSGVDLACCCDSDAPLRIGANDMFLATYWTTAYTISHCLKLTNIQEFIYMLQDFEPAFYPWSSNYALALATYDMNYRAIINEQGLADFFCTTGTGRFADPSFIDGCSVFEPAVDDRYFYNAARKDGRPNRLLFYARPGRNMRGIAYDALRIASADAAFAGTWEFLAIGGTGLPELELANGKRLRPAAWMTYSDYADLIRQSDILLCLMLSPHTSYPTLEMVACGGITVTNTFATKTRESLLKVSPNLMGAPPDPQTIADCLIEAARRVSNGHDRSAALSMPRNWTDALVHTTAKIKEIFTGHVSGL